MLGDSSAKSNASFCKPFSEKDKQDAAKWLESEKLRSGIQLASKDERMEKVFGLENASSKLVFVIVATDETTLCIHEKTTTVESSTEKKLVLSGNVMAAFPKRAEAKGAAGLEATSCSKASDTEKMQPNPQAQRRVTHFVQLRPKQESWFGLKQEPSKRLCNIDKTYGAYRYLTILFDYSAANQQCKMLQEKEPITFEQWYQIDEFHVTESATAEVHVDLVKLLETKRE